ncbi:MAG TPA: cupin domain-containing protein [Acidimicrobiia bacterium]|nr:cupin domain-containing protein [Acidimicrobiia bacterium]
MGYTFIPDVASEVPVSADGTLSRVLHRTDRLRLVAFSFDRGQELTEHTAAVPVALQVVTGRLRVDIDDDSFEVGPGGWLHMEAHLAHGVVALEPTVALLTMLPGAA